MISQADIDRYNRDGYIVVPNVLSAQEVADLRRVTDEFVEASRKVSQHDAIYDLEPGHSAAEPRVRRIKSTSDHHEVYARMVTHPGILAVLRALWGPNIRFDVGKLNLKAAGFGSPVEWHQDWAFYPHTNDDLAAVGIMIDDFTTRNGSMLALPGSHKGPTYDHHSNGYFVGGMDPSKCDVDFSKAEMLTGSAGSISVHHVRLIHGSAANLSGEPRRYLLHQYRAADAWPLVKQPASWKRWTDQLVSGSEPAAPRLVSTPVRLPLPEAPHQGSIYENQRDLENRYFKTAEQAVAGS